MDFDKIPFTKAFPFLAGILPGSSLFYLFEVGHPGTLRWFFSIGLLGYKSKVFLLLFVLFLLGYSLNKFLASLLGSFGWVLGRTTRLPLWDRPPYDFEAAPWRDQRWRAAYAKRFAINLPQDLAPTPGGLDEEMISAISRLQPGEQPTPEQAAYPMKVCLDAVNRINSDREWKSRYLHLHVAEITKKEAGFTQEIGAGLDSNLVVASLIIVVASWFVPQVRLLWLVLPAYLWFFVSLLDAVQRTIRFFDASSTLQAQCQFLIGSD